MERASASRSGLFPHFGLKQEPEHQVQFAFNTKGITLGRDSHMGPIEIDPAVQEGLQGGDEGKGTSSQSFPPSLVLKQKNRQPKRRDPGGERCSRHLSNA